MEERTMASEMGTALGLRRYKGVRKARAAEFWSKHTRWLPVHNQVL